MCEELRKRKVDVGCIQKVRWKDQGACFVGTSGQSYKLRWSGNDAGFGGVGILVKEEISGNVVEVRRKSDRATAIVLTLGREVMRVICAYGPQSGRPDAEKVYFYDKMGSEWHLGSSSEIMFLWGILMDMWENMLRVLKVYTGEWCWEKKCRRKKIAGDL